MSLSPLDALPHEVIADPFFGRAVVYVLEHLGDLRGKVVLDVGCGDGILSVCFAFLGATVIGVDKDKSALERATERAAELGLAKRCRFHCEEVEAMSLRDASADVVFSRSTMQYVDRPKALREFQRILKADGVLALIENLPHNPFINLYRLRRRLCSRSTEQRRYLNSIRSYLTFKEIASLRSRFGQVVHREFHLFSVFAIYLLMGKESGVFRRAYDSMTAMDGYLLRHVPFLRRWAWFTAVVCSNPRGESRCR